jgi:hypothetical protein
VKAPTRRHPRLLPPPPQRLAPRACETVRLTRPVAEPELRWTHPVAEPELSEQPPASIAPPRLVEAREPVPVLLFESGPADW